MATSDQSLYTLRYNQISQKLEASGGTPEWNALLLTNAGGGGGSPAGVTGDFQYNDDGEFAAAPLMFSSADESIFVTTRDIVFTNDANEGIYFENAAKDTVYGHVLGLANGSGLELSGGDGTYHMILASDGSIGIPNIPGDPASPARGAIWFDQNTDTWRGYDGTDVGTFTFVAD